MPAIDADPTLLERPRLTERVVQGLDRRLVLLTGGPGTGKSTLIAQVRTARPDLVVLRATSAHRAPTRLACHLAATIGVDPPAVGSGPEADRETVEEGAAADLAEQLVATDRLAVAVDDTHVLHDSVGMTFLEALVRHAPASMSLVLSSRLPCPFPVARLRLAGAVQELTGADLAFTPEETAIQADEVLDAEEAAGLHARTGGWVAAVVMAVARLRGLRPSQRPAAIGELGRVSGPLADYLSEELLAELDAEATELVRLGVALPRLDTSLAAHLGVADPVRLVTELEGRGELMWVDGPAFGVRGLVADHAAGRLPMDPWEQRTVWRRAAWWAATYGDPEQALDLSVRALDKPLLRRLLADHGMALVQAGATGAVLTALEAAGTGGSHDLELTWGEALRVTGDWDAALSHLTQAAADPAEPPAPVAWRIGLIHHMRGDLDAAMATYDAADLTAGPAADVATVQAWAASARWLRGEVEACRRLAHQALEEALASGADVALAAAHTVLAMVAAGEGDLAGHDDHEQRALEAADRAGDVLQRIRVLINRSAMRSEQGRYADMQAVLDEATTLASRVGYAHFQAFALVNRADASLRLGDLDASLADLREAEVVFRRLGSTLVAYALFTLGQVHLVRGETTVARRHLERAVELGEEAEDVQVLVPALAHLARTIAEEEPERARHLVDRALDHPVTVDRGAVLVDAAWVALLQGDATSAAQRAEQVDELADQPPVQAEAALVAGLATDPVDEARLRQARRTWEELGDPIGADTARYAQGLAGGDAGLADSAEEELRRRGASGRVVALRRVCATPGQRTVDPSDAQATVSITTLGAFRVERAGQVVDAGTWQSRKARDLLKILLAAGGPVSREVLGGHLWPDETDAAKVANRLNVALSTCRRVLAGSDGDGTVLLRSVDGAVVIDRDRVNVDLDRFLDDARHGLADPAGELSRARLVRAEQAYTGDFLAEEPYADWASGRREQARGTYVQVATTLMGLAEDAGDHHDQARLARRVLQRDPFDEPAHLSLVRALEAAGRHGEARRSFAAYMARMRELDVEPAPYPELAA